MFDPLLGPGVCAQPKGGQRLSVAQGGSHLAFFSWRKPFFGPVDQSESTLVTTKTLAYPCGVVFTHHHLEVSKADLLIFWFFPGWSIFSHGPKG